MKSHISATIDQNLLKEVDRFGQEERRSRSQIIELALERYLNEKGSLENQIVTSNGQFTGSFSRDETYER